VWVRVFVCTCMWAIRGEKWQGIEGFEENKRWDQRERREEKRKRGTDIDMVRLAVAVAVAAGCMARHSSPGEGEGESLGPWTNRTSLGCVLFRLERGPSMSI
jgi:hypothetical protein